MKYNKDTEYKFSLTKYELKHIIKEILKTYIKKQKQEPIDSIIDSIIKEILKQYLIIGELPVPMTGKNSLDETLFNKIKKIFNDLLENHKAIIEEFLSSSVYFKDTISFSKYQTKDHFNLEEELKKQHFILELPPFELYIYDEIYYLVGQMNYDFIIKFNKNKLIILMLNFYPKHIEDLILWTFLKPHTALELYYLSSETDEASLKPLQPINWNLQDIFQIPIHWDHTFKMKFYEYLEIKKNTKTKSLELNRNKVDHSFLSDKEDLTSLVYEEIFYLDFM